MAEQIRCFFALWPADELRTKLATLTRETVKKRGKPVQPGNLHITLAFLGNINIESLDCYLQQAENVRFSPFELVLDEVGYFPRPKVFWAGASEMPDALSQLHFDLNQQVSACGYEPEKRPFVPHITLARKCPFMKRGELDSPLNWQVDRFCLVQSHTYPEGVQYEVMHEWLAG
jgi:2'-5' RNA ligase